MYLLLTLIQAERSPSALRRTGLWESRRYSSVFAALSLQNPLDTSVPERIPVSTTVLWQGRACFSLCSHDALNRSVFYMYSPTHYLPLYPDHDPRQPLRLQSIWSSNHSSKQSQLHSSGHNALMSFIYSSPCWGSSHKPCALTPPGFALDIQSPSFGIQTKWNFSLWINSTHSNSKELWLSDYWLCSRFFKVYLGAQKPKNLTIYSLKITSAFLSMGNIPHCLKLVLLGEALQYVNN